MGDSVSFIAMALLFPGSLYESKGFLVGWWDRKWLQRFAGERLDDITNRVGQRNPVRD